jgi:FecR protein
MKDADDANTLTDAMDSLLRRGLQIDPLSPEAMQRIHAATKAEWLATVDDVKDRRRWGVYASAAAVLMAVLLGGIVVIFRNPVFLTASLMSRVDRMEYPGVLEQHTWSRSRALANGEALRKGQQLLARGGARITLPGSGSLRVAAGTSLEVASDSLFILSDGDVYVDMPPGLGKGTPLVVQTPAGSFTHVGTQFQVAVHGGSTEVRVREGQVRWSSSAGDLVALAGTKILINERGAATTGQTEAAGADWLWAEILADPFAIDNRSLTEFLRYFARETGRSLLFADASVEQRANSTKLHGSVQKLSQMEALSAVMATTSLRFTLDSDSVRIDSAGDAEKKGR